MCGLLYNNTEIKHNGLVWPFDPYSLTINPESILRDASVRLSRTSIRRWCSLLPLSKDCCCDISSSIYQSNMSGVKQVCQFFLSLLCGLFNPPQSPAGHWLAETNQLKDTFTDQYLSSSALPELRIPVIRGLSLGQVPGHAGLFEARLLRWSGTNS